MQEAGEARLVTREGFRRLGAKEATGIRLVHPGREKRDL
jgi:hypothetical protein